MSLFKNFFKPNSAKRTCINDHFPAQMSWIMLIGVWRENFTIKYVPKLVVHIISWTLKRLIFFIMLHIAILFSVTLYFDILEGDFADITYSLSQAVIFGFIAFIILYFQLRENVIFDIVDFVNANFRYRSAKGMTYVTSETTFYYTRIFTTVYSIMAEMTVLQPVIQPFFSTERALPLRCWYPFDQFKSPAYEIVYVLQMLAQIEMAMGFCNSLTFTLSVAIMICGQFDMLFCSIKNIRYTALLLQGGHTKQMRIIQSRLDLSDDQNKIDFYSNTLQLDNLDDLDNLPKKSDRPKCILKPNDTYLMDLNEEMHIALADIVQHHQMIIKVCNMLEDITSPFILVKSIEISFQICVLALTFMRTTGSLTDNINTAQYLALTLFDLFMISYLGQIIQNQSVRMRDFLYEGTWYECGAPFRRSLLIILLYTVSPQIVTGGKFFALGYDKFTAMLRLSFSYFTLLNQVGEGKP